MRCSSPAYARRVIAALHPRLWGVHLLGLAAIAAAIALGIWQWNVGDGRKALQSNEYAHSAPVPLASVLSPGATFPASELGRPVRVGGTWDSESTVLVATGGKPAYWVATAVRTGPAAIYVVRGATDSQAPVALDSSAVAADVTGWLEPDQSSLTPAAGRTLPVMSNGLAAPFEPVTLLDGYVIAETPAAGLAAVPEPTLPKASFWTGLRNWSYAFEWWIFACLFGFMWWRQIREMTEDPGAPGPADGR